MTIHSVNRRAAGLLAVLMTGAIAGCAGNGPPVDQPTSAFDVLQQTIFDTRCATGGCHTSAADAGGLILDSGRSYGNLVGAASANEAAFSAGLQRVVPFNPDSSFLLIKVTTPGAGQGTRMPRDGAALSPSDIELIRSWIASGAPGSTVPTPTLPPSATPIPQPTATEPPLPASTATITLTPTVTSTPTQTSTGTLPPTSTPTRTATVTASSTATSSATATATPTIDPASTFTRLEQDLFAPTCATAFCHDALTQANGLNLEPDAAYAALVGATPGNGIAAERGWLRVDPGKLDTSYLYFKLTLLAFDRDLGSPMPLVGGPLSADKITRVSEWILRGAPND
ncbi:MAG: hypothetical protein HY270_24260 [Deltaproteobacteria bacterium]|nr:hypothetical protein [Deltaproteobacteria bacterium]